MSMTSQVVADLDVSHLDPTAGITRLLAPATNPHGVFDHVPWVSPLI
jgi:hypothetical protein